MAGGYTVDVSDGTPIFPTPFDPFYEENSPRAVAIINGSKYPLVSYEIVANAHGGSDTATIELPIEGNPDFSVDLFRGQTISDAAGNIVDLNPSNPNALPNALKVNKLYPVAGGGDTGLSSTLPGGGGYQVAYDYSPVYAEIWAGFPDKPTPQSTDISQLHRRFLGIVDTYRPTFHENTVSFMCRTIAAPMLDGKITHCSAGQSIVSFLRDQAKRYGLGVYTKLPGGDLSSISIAQVLGREFIGGASFNSALHGKRIMDLIMQGALFDDADVWVDNVASTIHYEAAQSIQRGKPIALKWGRDFTLKDGAVGEHAIQFSKRVRVEVRTYSKRTKTSMVHRMTGDGLGGYTTTTKTKTATSTPIFGTDESLSTSYDAATGTTSVGISSATGGGFSTNTSEASDDSSVDKYPFFVAGLSPAAVNAFAMAQWRRISQLQYRLAFSLPMTKALLESLKITSAFSVTGMPYARFNTAYLPRRVTERFGASGWSVDPECNAGPIPSGEV